MTNVKSTGSRFIVDFGNLKLPDAIEKRLDAEIRKLVLSAIADIDFQGDLRVKFPFPPGRTLGIIFEDINRDFPTFPRPQPRLGEPLSALDHTSIITSIMKKPFHIIRQLDRTISKRPSETEVLIAATKVASFDAYTKGRIEEVLGRSPELEKAQKKITKTTAHSLKEINAEIDKAQGISNLIETIQMLRNSDRYKQDEAIETGLEIALQLLEDGKETIYFSGSGFYEIFNEREKPGVIFKSAGDHASDIGKEDAKGAVEGAVVGAVVGGSTTAGPGAVPGAVIGGVGLGLGKSAAEVIGKVWDWIFG